MSQEYYSGGESSSAGGSSSNRSSNIPSSTNPVAPRFARPNYITVGSGSTSESAAALTALIEEDSGYGGSIAGSSVAGTGSGGGWHPGLTEDRPTPSHTPVLRGASNNPRKNRLQCTSKACTDLTDD